MKPTYLSGWDYFKAVVFCSVFCLKCYGEHVRMLEQKESVEHLLQHVSLKGHEAILDIGCGDGAISAQIASKVERGYVLGIDISPSMVEFAKIQHSRDHKNLRIEVQDAKELNFAQSFDLITSFSAMHWILEQKIVLQRCHRSLRPQGILWVQMPLGVSTPLQEVFEVISKEDKWKPYFLSFTPAWRFYSPAEYRDLMEDSHFKMIYMHVYEHEDLFSSRESFENYVKNSLPYVRILPQDRKSEFVKQLVSLYLDRIPLNQEGKIPLPIKKIELQAQKM